MFEIITETAEVINTDPHKPHKKQMPQKIVILHTNENKKSVLIYPAQMQKPILYQSLGQQTIIIIDNLVIIPELGEVGVIDEETLEGIVQLRILHRV